MNPVEEARAAGRVTPYPHPILIQLIANGPSAPHAPHLDVDLVVAVNHAIKHHPSADIHAFYDTPMAEFTPPSAMTITREHFPKEAPLVWSMSCRYTMPLLIECLLYHRYPLSEILIFGMDLSGTGDSGRVKATRWDKEMPGLAAVWDQDRISWIK